MKKLRVFYALLLSLFIIGCDMNVKNDESNYGEIKGKVCYSNATDFSDISVYLEKTDGLRSIEVVDNIDFSREVLSARSLEGLSTTGADGTFTFKKLEAGTYTVYAESEISTKKAVAKNIVVEAGKTTTIDDLVLIATGSVIGKITKDSSDSLSYGYRVSIAGTGYQAITDVDGSFIIEKVPAGTHNIIIEREALCYFVSESVTVKSNETTDIGSMNFTSEEIYSYIISIKWLGSFSSSDQISNPKYLNAYYNTTDGCSYIYDGANWTMIASKGEQGEKGDKGESGTSIEWLGSFSDASLIANPKDMNAYYNTTDGCSYIYVGGQWTLLAQRGLQGIQGESITWRGEYADSSEITDPQYLDVYYNTVEGCSYIYDGEMWTLLAQAGRDAVSIKWKGSLTTAPENPEENWAYYNTEDGCSYIYDGNNWTIMAKAGAKGAQGICVIWRGEFASSEEIGNPEAMNAYYNTTDGCSYIYDGEKWSILVKAGANGISIVWKGELYAAPENPEENWAYYDNRYGCSYIFDGTKWNLLANGIAPGGITEEPESLSFELYSNIETSQVLEVKFKSSKTDSLCFKWYKKTASGNVYLTSNDFEITEANVEYTSEYVLPKSNYLVQEFYCIITNSYEGYSYDIISEVATVTQTIPELGVPVVTIDTNGVAIVDKENWIPGSIKLEGAVDESWNFDEVKLGIKGRGNTTWKQKKKPYAIKLDKKQSVMGMPKHKRWVLIANYLDNSFIKNEMAFYLSEQMGMDYTVHGDYANFVLNGEYLGLYWLGEAIKADENRVNIDEDNDYLIELDTYFDETWKFKSSIKNLPYNIKNDDSMTEEKVQYLSDKITEIESILYSENFPYKDETKTEFDKSFLNYIDIDSFAKFYLVNEIMRNNEVDHPKSCYMTYEIETGILKAGPVWDFDWAAAYKNNTRILKSSIYYDALFKTSELNNKVNELLNDGSLDADLVSAEIDRLKDLVEKSQKYDQLRWGVHANPNGAKLTDFYEDIETIRSCMCGRIKYMQKNKFNVK